MSNRWTVTTRRAPLQSDEELKGVFGDNAIISRVGSFNLIHLDNPSPEIIERRISEFDPNDLFEDNCPLCQMLREEGGNVVYDEFL
jgi:hypothetical protein